jgi:hypothetical protein
VFRPAESSAPRRRPVPRIGAMGRLVHQKGFDVLLAALPRVLAERAVEVVLVGDGELQAALERQALGLPVSLPGALTQPEQVADFLRDLDVFVMPSRYEGLPNAVLEALACGVPVVATDVPGMREATGLAARLVPPEDPDALAGALLEALPPADAAVDGTPAPSPLSVPSPLSAPAPPSVASFDDVAAGHLEVFERAVRRRAAGGRQARGPALVGEVAAATDLEREDA